MIKQAELRQLQTTLSQLSELEAAARIQKADIIRRLDADEGVQPGKVGAIILETKRRTFSESALAEILGPVKTAELKASLPETVSRSLKLLS